MHESHLACRPAISFTLCPISVGIPNQLAVAYFSTNNSTERGLTL